MKFVQNIFHAAKCGVVIVAGLAVSSGLAHAATFTYTIWTGAGLNKEATFPVPTTGLLLPSFTDSGPIDFANLNPNGGSNTFGDFFGASSAGTHLSAAQLATSMSSLGDGVTTFIRITTSYTLTSPFTFSLNHDDGAAVYLDGAGNGGQVCGNPLEASENTQSCLLPTGTHNLTLLYTEDNGSPAILRAAALVGLPNPVPEPISMGLLGGGLALLGVARWRRSLKK
jgi:PEP-CTERM motif